MTEPQFEHTSVSGRWAGFYRLPISRADSFPLVAEFHQSGSQLSGEMYDQVTDYSDDFRKVLDCAGESRSAGAKVTNQAHGFALWDAIGRVQGPAAGYLGRSRQGAARAGEVRQGIPRHHVVRNNRRRGSCPFAAEDRPPGSLFRPPRRDAGLYFRAVVDQTGWNTGIAPSCGRRGRLRALQEVLSGSCSRQSWAGGE